MEQHWQSASNFVAILRRSTSVFPFFVVDVITGLLALACLSLAPNSIVAQVISLVLFALCILATLACALYFMIKDPDRLQSETQQIRKQALDLLADESHNLGTTARDIVDVVNPRNPFTPADDVVHLEPKELPPPQPPEAYE